MSNPWKEPRFFVFYDWAQNYFRNSKGISIKSRTELMKRYMLKGYRFQRYFGESVPDYTSHHRADELGIPMKIRTNSADVKLIYILRNPIERLISSYFHSKKNGGETRPISECLKNSESCLSTSLYPELLKRYLEAFPQSAIKIVSFEDLATNPERTMDEIFDFLEIDYLRGMHYAVHDKTSPSSGKNILTAEDYDEIIGPITEDIKRLEELIGRCVPNWDLSQANWVKHSEAHRQPGVTI